MIILLPNCSFLSETSRMLAIARALDVRGEKVGIASHGGPYEHLLDEAGVRWHRLEPAMDLAAHRDLLDGLLSLGGAYKPMYAQDFVRAAVTAEAAYLRESGARMAVIGFNLPSYVSSRVAGVPLATSHGGLYVPPVLERGLCPVPVNPPRPEFGKLPKVIQRWLANCVPFWLKAPTRELNRVADEFGVERVPSFMALLCGDLTLVNEIPEVLGIPRAELEGWRPRRRALRPSTRLRYTGPLFAMLDQPVPERVEVFLAGPEPVVYVSPTSVSAEFLRTLVTAVRAAGARVLLSATMHEVRDLEGDGVLVERILPNHRVMPRVAAAVIMGGQGSVQTAMVSGTPFVGLPLQGEQEFNVHLAERLGMAIRLSPSAAGTPALTQAVRRLLDEASFREAAAKVRNLYSGTDGAAGAAQAIITYLHEQSDHTCTS
jgi:UDP:flavonoid glycosyltransferase YjiC (YdhE family)